jgi:hypothetical protein
MSATYPGIRTPLSAAAVIGIITYLVVINLNLLIGAFQCTKSFLLRDMGAELSASNKQGWKSKAKSFEAFPHQDKNPKPSNWWLLIYTSKTLVSRHSTTFCSAASETE